jgi:hypothetical protein
MIGDKKVGPLSIAKLLCNSHKVVVSKAEWFFNRYRYLPQYEFAKL